MKSYINSKIFSIFILALTTMSINFRTNLKERNYNFLQINSDKNKSESYPILEPVVYSSNIDKFYSEGDTYDDSQIMQYRSYVIIF
jgi:hypothetical protein